MKILHTAMKWDYGKPEQGYSFEHQTFYKAFEAMGHEIIYFDVQGELQEHGRTRLNRRLWEIVRSEEPDLMFCVLYQDELDQAVVKRISEETSTTTLNWFCDDHWRFHDYSLEWAPTFNWVVTTVSPAVAPYEDYGVHNVIRSQWACNTFLYRKPEDENECRYGTTFVGMAHGNRSAIIESLRRAGIDVQTWGSGWSRGRLTVEQMAEVFSRSRINLNFANASVTVEQVEKAQKKSSLRSGVAVIPGAARVLGKADRAMGRYRRQTATQSPYVMQLKARTFEVPGCGGFLLTQEAPELDRYFVPGEEVATFRGADDLAEMIRHYLEDEARRQAIADAGYARVMRDHTYERRFDAIFRQIGLRS